MRNRDRLLDLLAKGGAPVCDDCASHHTGIHPRQQVNSLAARLASTGEIARAHLACALCKRTKVTSSLIRDATLRAPALAEPLEPLEPARAETLVVDQRLSPSNRSNDEYGKAVPARAAGGSFQTGVSACWIPFPAGAANLDGVVGGEVAVEVEARNSKQIRGALLDLIVHPYPKKLLILIPSGNLNPNTASRQCEHILALFLPPDSFRVVVLEGTWKQPSMDADAALVQLALRKLGSVEQS